MSNSIADLFVSLVEIPSPSGFELEVARYIKGRLDKTGVTSRFDDSGRKNNSNCGNLIATIPGGKTHIMFIAHIDTVETGKERIKPVVRHGSITSDGTTILGVDNKGAVACLIAAAKEIKQMKNRPTVTMVFSTREENGRMGANYITPDHSTKFIFVLDGSDKAGTFINQALGQIPFNIEIYGKEVHAGYAPQKGINAIMTASLIISRLAMGKARDGSTLNIGRIRGGTVVNVVPGKTTISGEVRAFTKSKMDKRLAEVEGVVKSVCKKTKCTYKFTKKVKEGAPPFSTGRDTQIAALAKAAATSSGLKFSMSTVRATTESNILKHKGFAILGMSRGGSMPHSLSETITFQELEALKTLIVETARNANSFA